MHLVWAAEDVRVVLLEAAHSRQACQCAAELVAVQHTKVCKAVWSLGRKSGQQHQEQYTLAAWQ